MSCRTTEPFLDFRTFRLHNFHSQKYDVTNQSLCILTSLHTFRSDAATVNILSMWSPFSIGYTSDWVKNIYFIIIPCSPVSYDKEILRRDSVPN